MTRPPPRSPRALDELPQLDDLRRRKGRKWATYGADVLPLWIADMDLPVAEPVRRVLEEHARTSDVGYAFYPEWEEMRRVFAERARTRWNWEVDPARVAVILNLLQGMDCAVTVLSEPGEGVVVQTPIYPPFLGIVEVNRRRLVANPLRRRDSRWEMDLADLVRKLDDQCRLLLFCNPHNPTGRVFERQELEALAEIVLEHDLLVVADEIWADLVYPGHRHLPFATLGPELERRTVTLTSATKAFNLAGLPCAVAVFGSGELLARFRTLSSYRLGHPGIVDVCATLAAWREGDSWLAEVTAYLDGNRHLLADFLGERLPGVELALPEATYLAWLDFRRLHLPDEPAPFVLERSRVALSDGRDFGAVGSGFARLNFATSREVLELALERIAATLTQCGSGSD